MAIFSRPLLALALVPLAQPFALSPLQQRAARPTSRTTHIRSIAELIRPKTEGKPSLSDALPDCPPTVWNADEIDLEYWQSEYKKEGLPTCPIEVVATPEANAAGVGYFKERSEEYRDLLLKHGTIWFRGFDLMKTPEGFRSMWEAIDLDPCLDPIHNSGLRKFLAKGDAVYEEVNKQSLSKHYIGLHNESTEKKTAKYGAFVCFKPATVSGGEFMIADGEAILRDLDPEVLKLLYQRRLRISVTNLDLDVLDLLPAGTKEDAMAMVGEQVDKSVAAKFDMDLEMIWGTDGNEMRLQAIEPPMTPINRHPVTGRPAWFCNMHNHARFLRDRRPCSVPEVGMTDVYYSDLSKIPGEVLLQVQEACEKNIVYVPMQAGDVLLCDNYRVQHGRDIFEGDRLHAVSWFGDKSDGMEVVDKPGDLMNSFINKFVVGD